MVTNHPHQQLAQKPRRRRLWGFARNDSGVTMIEFGLLAPIFFVIIVAMMETALVALASQVLDSATNDAVRLIRTGQAQSDDFDVEDFRDQVCARLLGLFDCSQLKVRIRILPNFAAAALPPPIDPITGNWVLTEDYDPGTAKDIIIAETYYKWPVVVNSFGLNFSTTADNKRLISAVRVWRNEPF